MQEMKHIIASNITTMEYPDPGTVPNIDPSIPKKIMEGLCLIVDAGYKQGIAHMAVLEVRISNGEWDFLRGWTMTSQATSAQEAEALAILEASTRFTAEHAAIFSDAQMVVRVIYQEDELDGPWSAVYAIRCCRTVLSQKKFVNILYASRFLTMSAHIIAAAAAENSKCGQWATSDLCLLLQPRTVAPIVTVL